jgi:hypothetical protein
MKYLSRNEAKVIYIESEEEQIVVKLWELIQVENKDFGDLNLAEEQGYQMALIKKNFQMKLGNIRAWAVNTHSSYSRVFVSDDASAALPWLLRFGPHICNAPWMKVSWIGDTFSSQH